MFTISITEKGGQKRLVECTKSVVTLGRLQGNDVVLPLGNVSKRHAQIQLSGGTFTVTDIGSTNGTYINGRKISGPTELHPGDKIYLGEFIVSVAPNESEEPSSPGIPVLSSERPSIPPPVPRTRKSVPPPRPDRRPPPQVIEDNEDTLTSIDESILPDIQSTFKRALSTPKMDIPLPKRTRRTAPISAPVEQLIDFVAIEERKIDRNNLPSVTEPAVAARVRQILSHLVTRLDAEDKLPEGFVAGALFMESFLSIVDIGPLCEFLNDASVEEVRINDRDTLLVSRGDGFSLHERGYATNSLLSNALQCLTAGMAGQSDAVDPTGAYRLENGDLVVCRTASHSSTPAAMIYRATALREVLPEAAALIRSVLERGESIAIGGAHPLSKLRFVELLANERSNERIVFVEPRPLHVRQSPSHVHLTGTVREAQGGLFENLLCEAGCFQAERIIVRCATWQDIPAMLRFAASGIPLVAEIPLGAKGDDALMLRAGLLSGAMATEDGIDVFARMFRLLVICSDNSSGAPVTRILQSEKLNDGTLKLVTVFETNL